MTYNYCKTIIQSGNYDKTDMLDKLDVFLLNSRITDAEHNELTALISTPTKRMFKWKK